jgi:hypothetical protein
MADLLGCVRVAIDELDKIGSTANRLRTVSAWLHNQFRITHAALTGNSAYYVEDASGEILWWRHPKQRTTTGVVWVRHRGPVRRLSALAQPGWATGRPVVMGD